jgi:hypothetical protein
VGCKNVPDLHEGGFNDRRFEFTRFDAYYAADQEITRVARKYNSDDGVETSVEFEEDAGGARISCFERSVSRCPRIAHQDNRVACTHRMAHELRKRLTRLNRACVGEFSESIDIGFG